MQLIEKFVKLKCFLKAQILGESKIMNDVSVISLIFKGVLVTASFAFKYIHNRYLLLRLKVFT